MRKERGKDGARVFSWSTWVDGVVWRAGLREEGFEGDMHSEQSLDIK